MDHQLDCIIPFESVVQSNGYAEALWRTSVLEQITSSVIDWGSNFGLVGLALVSFTESIIQPVPPDLLVIPMSLEAASTLELLAIFLVATIFSVLALWEDMRLDFMQEGRLSVDSPDLHYPGDWMRYW